PSLSRKTQSCFATRCVCLCLYLGVRFLNGCFRCIDPDRRNPVLHSRLTFIYLAGSNDLPIGTGQREMKFPVRGILTGISFGKWGILFNGSNAIQAGGFGCISFAGEYHLPVCSLEHKLEFAILTGTYD